MLVLWRNERLREPAKQLQELMDAFEVKIRATLDMVESEVPRLQEAPFGIGHIALVCALGYLDYRFAFVEWRFAHPRLGVWFANMSERPAVCKTEPTDEPAT